MFFIAPFKNFVAGEFSYITRFCQLQSPDIAVTLYTFPDILNDDSHIIDTIAQLFFAQRCAAMAYQPIIKVARHFSKIGMNKIFTDEVERIPGQKIRTSEFYTVI